MTLNESTIQIVVILVIIIAILGVVAWYSPLLITSAKSKGKSKLLINKLTTLAIYLIWLIGLSIAVMALGFIANGVTFDSFLWGPFEMILIISLGALFIISMAIVQYDKDQGDYVRHHFYLLAKHLAAQIKFIMVIILTFIIKFLILGE